MAAAGPIAPALEGIVAKIPTFDPTVASAIGNYRSEMQRADLSKSLKVGDKLPPFTLNNAVGKPVSSTDLLAKGSLVVTFYRGAWCPFCNIALAGLSARSEEFAKRGATLVAISPQLPDGTLSTQEKLDLKFPVLSDPHNTYARQLGILTDVPLDMLPAMNKLGHDLDTTNGDSSHELPAPATYLVSKEGVVLERYLDADYAKRVEPKTVLEWVERHQS